MKKGQPKTINFDDLINNLTPKQRRIFEEQKKYYYLVTNLRKLRLEKGMSQNELAKKINLPRTTITKVESGERNATLGTLMSITQGLGKKLEIRLV